MIKRFLFMISLVFLFSPIFSAEKDRLAVMDVADEAKLFNKTTIANVTDYIFTKLQGTKIYWMVPKADRDTALEQAIEETVKGSRRECIDEKCQLSLVAQLQANFLINTKIKKLYEGTCNISISKFDVEKRAGVDSWEAKFNCTEKGLYETIDGFDFGGKKNDADTKTYSQQKNTLTIKKVLKTSAGTWSKNSTHRMDWVDAKAYCDNLKEDGYSDWRMPTISELRTLVKECSATETGGSCGVNDSCLSESKCRNNNCNGCPSSDGKYSIFNDTGRFWSSSERKEDKRFVWFINFFNGSVYSDTKTGSGSVRCVR